MIFSPAVRGSNDLTRDRFTITDRCALGAGAAGPRRAFGRGTIDPLASAPHARRRPPGAPARAATAPGGRPHGAEGLRRGRVEGAPARRDAASYLGEAPPRARRGDAGGPRGGRHAGVYARRPRAAPPARGCAGTPGTGHRRWRLRGARLLRGRRAPGAAARCCSAPARAALGTPRAAPRPGVAARSPAAQTTVAQLRVATLNRLTRLGPPDSYRVPG